MPKNNVRSLKKHKLSRANKLLRVLWQLIWLLLYRPSPVLLHGWRRFLLRVFGATVEKGAHPYPSAKIWAPWNLTMRQHSCLSHHVDCYCVDKVELGVHTTVSQYSYLCTASHDYTRRDMPLVTAPIIIGDYGWVTADVFVGPGVTIGEGAVVGARSTVTRNVPSWTVVAGSPPKIIGSRDFITSGEILNV
ncbi:LbetaH domain-containing protein [Methylovulum psychrotolerans]|uniref:Putative colanic acid biosynthesis acetyltransferase n=1 Tax=Methylovulum psychrotolerans TaxID=1704499 RepID=A0A1Z4BWM6_9GAMM|nr:putative colanic acid biosynthesis acetyltransferase [Methylovulum psychrotolerans]ASF45704.1 putative colanic acid biosynthesis acetyltransferase [Methylovulum psychrotolerans]